MYLDKVVEQLVIGDIKEVQITYFSDILSKSLPLYCPVKSEIVLALLMLIWQRVPVFLVFYENLEL